MWNRRGQFMPLLMIVALAVVIFLVGIVNVFKVAKAKLRAQNLADAVSLYVAGRMTQSMNMITDRNEALNHIYDNPGDPNQGSVRSNVCATRNSGTPPAIGCFALRGENAYTFQGGEEAAKNYARLIQTMNQIQGLFGQTYNMFIGADLPGGRAGVGASNSANAAERSLIPNLLNDIPDLAEPGVRVLVFNDAAGKTQAESEADRQKKEDTRNPGSGRAIKAIQMKSIEYAVAKPIRLKYKKRRIGNATETKTMGQLLGLPAGEEVGPLSIKNPKYLDGERLGAGAIVTIPVTLHGWPSMQVQARSAAYVIVGSGEMEANAQGHFKATHLIRLGTLR